MESMTMLVMVALLALPAPSSALPIPHLHLSSAIDKALKLAPSIRSSVSAVVASPFDSSGSLWAEEICAVWVELRAKAIAPVLRAAVALCLAMSVMLMMEAVFMSAVSLGAKLLCRTPEKRYRWEPIATNDEEMSSAAFPIVLVQIPMFNEKEVYKMSIGAACALTWPPDRIIIQVLDDSTDPEIKNLVELECRAWTNKGVNVAYEVRENRKGYKAGALRKGMEHPYVEQCDFVAIFDADFQPESDFLIKTIPFLVYNEKIALVQARWEFVNYNKCLMTRIQKISLDYHFKVEQESGSSSHAFFGFNGTAGVWRISAINEAGGWKDRTTVEDMDLAVRASLRGWQFLYVGNIKVRSELPSTFKAYCNQQHRWTCGAANLFRKMAWEILIAMEVSIWKKIHLIYSFFFVRRVVAPIVTFSFYCIVIPTTVLVPEVSIPIWGVFYIPTTITFLNAIRNPSSLHIMPFWILFENVMSMHRMKAAIIGLLETANFNEWVVTEKLGETLNGKLEISFSQPTRSSLQDKVSFSQLGFAVYLLFCASYNIAFGENYYYVYIYLQAFAFIIIGFGYVGTSTSNF
ncbi:probable glucomannan 4-beta-mannosyltransferase 4 isoform X1 [Zingiber officinale]|uniref:probable glucomannan 4-beta-mannosyltransferase 4 isoform X1 n=1 Tax=Zingiber officinale TaxID=94328 RepID=UPI001C4C1215|nr:probable glucomannan 4-beta-mannosyltransferase 4 isoform X1 [Zingiber officinale]